MGQLVVRVGCGTDERLALGAAIRSDGGVRRQDSPIRRRCWHERTSWPMPRSFGRRAYIARDRSSNADFAAFADATIRMQRACSARGITCTMVDLKYRESRHGRRLPLLLPVLPSTIVVGRVEPWATAILQRLRASHALIASPESVRSRGFRDTTLLLADDRSFGVCRCHQLRRQRAERWAVSRRAWREGPLKCRPFWCRPEARA